MRLLACLLATLAVAAAPTPKLVVEWARLTVGPGREPPPGLRPAPPRLEARFSLAGLPRGARFRFWCTTEGALAGLRQGRPVRASAAFLAVEGRLQPLEGGQGYHLTAPFPGRGEGQVLLVEVLAGGRLAARGSAPVVELSLPGAPGAGAVEP